MDDKMGSEDFDAEVGKCPFNSTPIPAMSELAPGFSDICSRSLEPDSGGPSLPSAMSSLSSSIDYKYLEGQEPGKTVLLRLNADERGTSFAAKRRDLLRTLDVDRLDIFHAGGPLGGSAKDYVANRMAARLAALYPDTQAGGITLETYSSGNTSDAVSRALKFYGLSSRLITFVNDQLPAEMIDFIRGHSDEVKVLNGTSPAPFADVLQGVDPNFAHRRHLIRATLAGLRPDNLFVPVGSGRFAGETVIASRFLAAAKMLETLGIKNVDQVLLEIYPSEGAQYSTPYDRLEETRDFDRFIEYIRANYPRRVPSVSDLQSMLPDVYLCGEKGLLLDICEEKSGRWVAHVSMDGSRGSVGVTDTRLEKVVATKLWMPRGSTEDVQAYLGAVNEHDPAKVHLISCEGKRIARIDADAEEARCYMEPSAATALAGVEEAVSTGFNLNGSTLVLSTGRGAYQHPKKPGVVAYIQPPFKGWPVPSRSGRGYR